MNCRSTSSLIQEPNNFGYDQIYNNESDTISNTQTSLNKIFKPINNKYSNNASRPETISKLLKNTEALASCPHNEAMKEYYCVCDKCVICKECMISTHNGHPTRCANFKYFPVWL